MRVVSVWNDVTGFIVFFRQKKYGFVSKIMKKCGSSFFEFSINHTMLI